MKRLINHLSRLLCLVAVVALAGCNHKELCYHHPHTVRVRVVYDWVNSPDADPDGMCVWFYPEDGSAPVRVDFSGTDGGYVELATGRYTAITFNNDTEAVQFGGSGAFDTHYAFTRDGGLLESIAGAAGKTGRRRARCHHSRPPVGHKLNSGRRRRQRRRMRHNILSRRPCVPLHM